MTSNPVTSFRTPKPYPNVGGYASHSMTVTDGQGCHHLPPTPTASWSMVISEGSCIPGHHARV